MSSGSTQAKLHRGFFPGAFPWLVPGPVFKTGVGSGNRLQVGSIPIRSRQGDDGPRDY